MKKGERKTQPTIKDKERITFLLEESIPKSQQERKKYMADCAFFYNVVFKDKLKHFIGMQLEALAQEGRPVVSDQFLRSSISVFRLIDEWFLKMESEHIGNINEIRNSLDDNKIIINKMNETYGKDKTNK